MENGIYAKFNTAKGSILVKLTHDLTPGTVGNFVALAEGNLENKAKPQGTPYYDGLKFHRVIPDFMIQGGDPQGTGSAVRATTSMMNSIPICATICQAYCLWQMPVRAATARSFSLHMSPRHGSITNIPFLAM
jgi:hypothetical protein